MQDVLVAATGARSMRAIARAIGMEPSTLTRQTKNLPVQTVVAICRAYGLPVVPMFVKVGYITVEEAASGMLEQALANATDTELMAETLRRVQAGKASKIITGPIDVSAVAETADEGFDVTSEFRSAYGKAAHRGPRKADQPHAD